MAILLTAREAGAGIVYLLSHHLGSSIIRWIQKRFPIVPARIIKITERLHVKDTIQAAFSRLTGNTSSASSPSRFGSRIPVTVAMVRLTPGLLTATSVASGIMGVRYNYFATGIAIASVIDDCATIILGVITGYGLRELNLVSSSWFMFLGVILDIVVVLAIQRFLWRSKAATAEK